MAFRLRGLGRRREAEALFARLLKLRNDVGLLSEEYDPAAKRLLGNFLQALTHVALINTARQLSPRGGPAEHRSGGMAGLPPARRRTAAQGQSSDSEAGAGARRGPTPSPPTDRCDDETARAGGAPPRRAASFRPSGRC